MRLLYFGNGERGSRCLRAMLEAAWNPVAVVAQEGGRQSLGEIPALAAQHGIPLLLTTNPNDPEFVARLAALEPDLMILASFSPILRAEILNVPARGTINLHGGKLPEYRGGSPLNWQIIRGEKEGGCTILFVDEGIDTGAILLQEHYPIGANETAGEITRKSLEIFPRMLLTALSGLADHSLTATPQDLESGAYYCKRYAWDGRIDWGSMKAGEVHNLVRGLHGPGLPGAFTHLDGEKIVIWRTQRLEQRIIGPPGRIALKRAGGVVVLAADGGVLVTEILRPGDEKPVAAIQHLPLGGKSFS